GGLISPTPPSISINSPPSECNKAPSATTTKCWGNIPRSTFSFKGGGFPLNVDMWSAVGPKDYPPRKIDLLSGSSPLISSESMQFGRSPFPARPTQRDVIDLITGQPLLQEVDFEVPFGGAVFRHVRTYSENVNTMSAGNIDNTNFYPEGSFW